MAKITAGILGGFSGKIGNIVGASWKGINTMRTLPASVANPRTTGQVAQRNAFTGAVDAAKQVLVSTIKPLNDRFAVKQSGYNLFISRNIRKFNDQGILTDKKSLVFSEGQLGNTEAGAVTVLTASTIRIEYPTTTEGKQLPTDQLYIVFISTQAEVLLQAFPACALRQDGVVELNFGMPGGLEFGYITFRSADGTKVANSRSFNI